MYSLSFTSAWLRANFTKHGSTWNKLIIPFIWILVDVLFKIVEEMTKLLISKNGKKKRKFSLVFNYATICLWKLKRDDECWLWHLRLGNLNFYNLKVLRKKNGSKVAFCWRKNKICEAYTLGKHHQQSFVLKSKLFTLINSSDVRGPIKSSCHSNNRCFILFIDDYTRIV